MTELRYDEEIPATEANINYPSIESSQLENQQDLNSQLKSNKRLRPIMVFSLIVLVFFALYFILTNVVNWTNKTFFFERPSVDIPKEKASLIR